jgi:pimeloyl-ACP methyl ester carboxylesterase
LAERLRGPLRTSLMNQDAVDQYSQDVTDGDIAMITVPTLVGVGRFDVADFRDIARCYPAEIPGATLIEFAAAAHLIALDAPAELVAELSPFLSGGTPAAGPEPGQRTAHDPREPTSGEAVKN